MTGGVPGGSATATATCPAGTLLLGGGGSVTTDDTPSDAAARVQMNVSRPVGGNSSSAWEVVGVQSNPAPNNNATVTVSAYAICG